jgi:peptidoglycan/LPS O-acetylase OafA/YrhL
LLVNPVAVHISTVSYGMYLLHLLCITLVRRITHVQSGPMVFFLGLASSIAAATASYRLLEAPLLRLKDRIAGRSDERAAAVAPSSP